MSFESEYRDLLIKQYWEQPNARAEIEANASSYKRIFEWLQSFLTEFDVDFATGDRLDILGRVVGIRRSIPYVVGKLYFGFDDNSNSRTFSDKFAIVDDTAPFFDKFSPPLGSLELTDSDFRFFIKAKIAKNSGSAFIVSDNKASIQDVINQTFGGDAYVVDNKDMSLTLYIAPSYRLDLLRAILALGLLPKPQGVQYNNIIQGSPGETFGFSDNPNSVGFADKFDLANQPGGFMASKVFL
jgi:hypothetical protein